ncbi:MAG: lysophospholipid acyltransferase family protein [Verrucomicrobiota bacterium]
MKKRVTGWLIALVVRFVGATLRIAVEDRAGVLERSPEHPMLWVFWHNRLFVTPLVYRRYLPERRGYVLASASRDGEIIADVMARFGVGSIRGSSSKRGASALRELVDAVKAGGDAVFTPDGPRGPRCKLQAGVIKLAQKTGAPIFPVVVTYHSVWELKKTWDRFKIPRPFSRVDVVLEELQLIEDRPGEDFLEDERERIEHLLLTESDALDAEAEVEQSKRHGTN